MIDLHCHILPGVDDGAENLEEAVAMARIAWEDGVEKIVATPHLYREGVDSGCLGSIEEKHQALCQSLRKNGISIDILAGAEVHISHNLIGEIRKNRRSLVLNGSSYMFVEFPSQHIFPGVKNLFFDLMSEGITPIIAHPERNRVLAEHPGLLFELIQMGAFCQANSGSFLGLYGPSAEETAFRFLGWNMVHFIASDGHNARSLPPRLKEAVSRAESAVGKEKSRALVVDNPLAVLEDREIPAYIEPIDPRKSKKSFRFRVPGLLHRRH
ncbi:MAG: tyrosine-protein phosphatase [Candidatus Aminicenantales bacterium]